MRIAGIILCIFLILGFSIRDNHNKPYHFPELGHFPKMPVSVTNPVTIEGVDLGRHLFYDPILSSDSTMSCGTCHKQKYAFSDSPERFSKGRNGVLMKRNTMALFNLAWYPAFFWDGSAPSIEEQIYHPLRAKDEMHTSWPLAIRRLQKNAYYKEMFEKVFPGKEIDSVEVAKAVAQFLRTLISYRSKYDRYINGMVNFSKDEIDGLALMNEQTKGDCVHCHTTDGDPLGTTLKFSNNGLDSIYTADRYTDKGLGGVTGKASDNGKFIIPSLRNLSFTGPYMHDGRFKTLEEVLDFYSSGVHESANVDSKMEYAYRGGVQLTSVEKLKIIAFLKTMNDSTFITDPEFSDPYNKD